MRRVVVAAACAAVLGVALPSQAQKIVTAKILSPANRQVVSGEVRIHGQGSSAAGIKRVELFVDGLSVASEQPADIKQKVDVGYNWDTTLAIGSSLPAANGEHAIVVEAVDTTGASDRASFVALVDNAPAAPSGLQVSITKQAALTWDANLEPDVTGYLVERDSGDGWALVSQTQEPTFAETLPPGAHSYRVSAVRFSPLPPGTRASEPSAPVTATVIAGSSEGRGGDDHGTTVGAGGTGSTIAGRHLGATGLPSALGLAGSAGLPSLPSVDAPLDWGSYEGELPYELPRGGVSLEAFARDSGSSSSWSVIPPDGLRWIAAGLLLIVTSALLRFEAVRVDPSGRSIALLKPLRRSLGAARAWFIGRAHP